MKTILSAWLGLVLAYCSLSPAMSPAASPPSEPDAQRQTGVPTGKVIGPLVWRGKSYPGVLRQYWLYVPAQYQPMQGACLMLFQDGFQYLREDGPVRAPIVFDDLIHRKEMPVTIGLFVSPGYDQADAPPEGGTWETSNRAAEYNSIADDYVRFLLDEFLRGALKGYNVTSNAAGHAICGAGSGGVAAFTAAWWRPDYFQKVIVHDGAFAQVHGADAYPEKIRAALRKPLRVAVQGSADAQNEGVAAALAEKGYDSRSDLTPGGDEGERLRQGGAVFADQLRWLWRDYLQEPPTMEELAAKAPPDAPFGTPGTVWQLTFGGMTQPVTVEFRANNVMFWVEYQSMDTYLFKDGQLLTTSPADPIGRYRPWEIKEDTFARVIHNEGKDVELGGIARGKLKRVPLSEDAR